MPIVQNLMKKDDFVAPNGDTAGKDPNTAMTLNQQLTAPVIKTAQKISHGVVMKVFALQVLYNAMMVNAQQMPTVGLASVALYGDIVEQTPTIV
jgi:hypothetical protein